MSDREPIDSLQIEIESSSTDASKSLDALVSSLKKLDRIGKSNSFLLVKNRLKGIAEVQFDTLDKQLRSITKNIKTLEIYKKALKNLEITTPKIDTTSVTEAVDKVSSELERVAEPAINSGEVFGGNQTAVKPVWLEDIQNECDEIVNSFDSSVENITAAKAKLDAALSAKQSNFSGETAFVNGSNFADTFSDKMAKLELQATILTDKMNKLAEADKPDPTQWNMLEKQLLAVRLQYQAIEQQTKKNASAVEELGNKSVKTKGFLGKMFDKFKNVAFYRIVRSLLAQLTRGISAGLQNIAKFSQEANSVMSAYKTEFTYMQNSLGAALLPVLQSLLPTITRISDGLVDITNSIGKVSAAINGQKTFLQAKKYAQSYADALDEVKRSTVGFDELNILGNNSANQNDTSQMFEKVDISGWDVAGSIAKIAVLVGSITTLLALIKGVNIGTVFTKMGKGIGTAYKYLKNASVWKKAGTSIAALAVEAVVCYNSFYDLGNGTKSLGSTLLTVIPVCAAVGVAMYAMLGPVGLAVGAIVGLTAAVVGYVKGQEAARKELNNKHFYESTTEMSVSLGELSQSFSDVWSETEALAQKNEEAIESLKATAKEFNSSAQIVEYYAGILTNVGTLTSTEASDMVKNVETMVDSLEKELNTRMESILNTFSGMANLAKVNFVNDLGEMKAEFLKFHSIISQTGGDYEQTIKDLVEESTKRELTEEELNELRTAINNLAALNTSYGQQEYVFDNLVEKARAGGIDFKDKDTTNSFLSEFGTAVKAYKDYLTQSYNDANLQIEDYKRKNEALLKQGAITEAQYNEFNQSFMSAQSKLKDLYDSAISDMMSDVEQVIGVVQSSALSNLNEVYKKAKEDYANSSWWHKLWHSETDDVKSALNDVQNDALKTINDGINDFYTTIGSEASAWLSESARKIIQSLFDTNYYYMSDGNMGGYYVPVTSEKGNIGDLVSNEISKNIPDYVATSPWKSYQDAADAGYSNIRTAHEFSRSNNKDKQKYGTYQAYLDAMYKKYVLGLSEYATGGFPEDGLFFANHSELVGKFSNGKTAVANNEQIVEGIKRGVSEAMSESNGNGGGSWIIQVVDVDGNIKGEKIVTAAERKNRRDGKTVISIGG